MNVVTKDLDNEGRIKLIQLTGEMDAVEASSIEQVIEKFVEDGCKGLILEMAGVSYIDSSGIRVLLSTYKKLKPPDGNFTILQPSEQVVMILELADLLDILSISQSMDDALQAVSESE